ncbi:2-hydroxyacid dehydrogenase [Thalassotalea piscium]|uniref:Glyoxylate/hydroxypyruvate reductase A n=1 Tax=Thalassotalea piscium TaxID=1230533 RepID=A0A7X0NIE9_9GAMM|nr:glyoxylate/hydroxypyruvate reductase A [Thalassotalea piscium]MBB6544038.1 glyoxylate/hydroxypyruvate reductase A [Thalassotalea piscium]
MSKVIPFISQLPVHEQNQWLAKLNQVLAPHQVILAERMSNEEKLQVKVAIVANPEPTELALFTNLVWVQSLWAGVERLVKEIAQPQFNIVRMVDPKLAQTMAEAVLTWSLYLHRQIPLYIAQQKRGDWQQHPVVNASECNIGVLGLGKLGQASALRLKDNGFNVYGWSASSKNLTGVKCYSGKKGLETLLANVNIVVVLLPLTDATDLLLNKALIYKLPKGANIINFARGRVIDLQAVIEGLDNGQLSHAVLDVFEHEPLMPNDPLWRHGKITILPHISAPTNLTSAAQVVRKNILHYFNEGIIPEAVNIKRAY